MEWLKTPGFLRKDLKAVGIKEKVSDALLRATVETLKGTDQEDWPVVNEKLAEDAGIGKGKGKGQGKGKGKGKGGPSKGKAAAKGSGGASSDGLTIERHWPEGKKVFQLPGSDKSQFWDQFASVEGDQCTTIKKFKAAGSAYDLATTEASRKRIEQLPDGIQKEAATAALTDLETLLDKRRQIASSDQDEITRKEMKRKMNDELTTAKKLKQNVKRIAAAPGVFSVDPLSPASPTVAHQLAYVDVDFWDRFYELALADHNIYDSILIDQELHRLSLLRVSLKQKCILEAVQGAGVFLQEKYRMSKLGATEYEYAKASMVLCQNVLQNKRDSARAAGTIQSDAVAALELILATWSEEEQLASQHITISTEAACQDGGDLQQYCEMLFRQFQASESITQTFTDTTDTDGAEAEDDAANPAITSISIRGSVSFKFDAAQAGKVTPVSIGTL